MLRLPGLLLAIFLTLRVGQAAPPSRVNPTSYEELPPSAEQVADATGLLPLYTELRSMTGNLQEDRWKILTVRQQLLEGVLSASLQVDATTARIDGEIAEANEFSNLLTDKRDRTVNRLNLASIATGGALGVVSSALQLSAKHARTGNAVGIGAGVIVAAISTVSLRAQNGKRQAFPFRSNMLAVLFEKPADSDDIYTPAVLAFLNSAAPVDPDHLTRKGRLIRTWIEEGRLIDPKTSAGQAKITFMTGSDQSGHRLSIDDLDDRRAMLEDLKAKLSLMKRDLAAFLLLLPEPKL